jgi:D-ribose pyranose/furanose isomerase RbsD
LRATDQKQKVIDVPLHRSAPKSYIRIGTACTKVMAAQNVALAPELREPHHRYRTDLATTYCYNLKLVLVWASKMVLSQTNTSTWRNSCRETGETT